MRARSEHDMRAVATGGRAVVKQEGKRYSPLESGVAAAVAAGHRSPEHASTFAAAVEVVPYCRAFKCLLVCLLCVLCLLLPYRIAVELLRVVDNGMQPEPQTPLRAYVEEVYGIGADVDMCTKELVYSMSSLQDEAARAHVHELFPDSEECFAFGAEGDVCCSKIASGNVSRARGTTRWASNEGSLLYNPRRCDDGSTHRSKEIRDGDWVEVTRWGRSCRRLRWHSCEGLTAVRQFYRHDETPIPYGCWFFVASGTGVFVNVGRALRFDSRSTASEFFGSIYGLQRSAASALPEYRTEH